MATQSYSTPGSYTFTLPISTGITIRIAGAAGGTGGTDGGPPAISGGAGGKGRYGVFTLPDYSYGDFTFVIGGAGGNGGNSGVTDFRGGSAGTSATSAGGIGGDDSPDGSSGGGGGGGGASSATFGSVLLAIAGGGGGGGGGTRGTTNSADTPGDDAGSFSADTTSPTELSNGGDGEIGGGDGGGRGGGGGGFAAGAAGTFSGNDNANASEGGNGGGSFYRSDRLTLSSQTTYTESTNGYIEIEYTEATFDTSAATVSKAGPYYTTAGTEIKFSDLRRDFRAQQPKTTSGGSETFLTDNTSISASELLRNSDVNETNPIVPQCQENIQISSSDNWKLSQFRNSIKYFYLTQDSSKTTLNYLLHGQPWQNNLPLNIVKTFFLEGTCGSTSPTEAALEFDAEVYNLNLFISGSVLGDGGAAGTSGVNGGNGGNAIYIDTNGTGTVTVRTVGSGSQVYGGGGGGGYGGEGGDGGTGSQTFSGSHYWANTGCVGNSMPCQYSSNFNSPIPCDRERCNNIRPCGDGINYTLWQRECWDDYNYTNYYSGGSGGTGGDGGVGEGYLQTRTSGVAGQDGSGGGTNAGSGGRGGTSGDGGDWGEDGQDGQTGLTGNNGNHTNGTAGEAGTSGGTAGRAVAGSGYTIDTANGVDSAYKGLK